MIYIIVVLGGLLSIFGIYILKKTDKHARSEEKRKNLEEAQKDGNETARNVTKYSGFNFSRIRERMHKFTRGHK